MRLLDVATKYLFSRLIFINPNYTFVVGPLQVLIKCCQPYCKVLRFNKVKFILNSQCVNVLVTQNSTLIIKHLTKQNMLSIEIKFGRKIIVYF